MSAKKGLVMEGGAMRGMFTAGVTDVFMENDIEFDGAVGTSAGAAFGCNYKSHQIGRVIRYNKRFCRDKRFCGLYSLLTTGDIYGADFGYHLIPDVYDVFDTETFRNSPMEFYTVSTDMETGKAVYHKCTDGGVEDIEWMRSSASMPLVSRRVVIDGHILTDGGTADSIALRFMESLGYDKNVVILTQHDGYKKQKNKLLPLLKLRYGKYPEFIAAVADRHIRYNETLEYIKRRTEEGAVFAIYPPEPLNIGAIEKDKDELERVYRIGRHEAEKHIDEVKAFLEK